MGLQLTACVTHNSTPADANAELREKTRVTKDEVPAEGQRKIPVIEQY
jgi:hypothetical protein